MHGLNTGVGTFGCFYYMVVWFMVGWDMIRFCFIVGVGGRDFRLDLFFSINFIFLLFCRLVCLVWLWIVWCFGVFCYEYCGMICW